MSADISANNNTIKLKQPPVFKLSFFSSMCERFGFYVLSFLLVLYLKQDLGLSDISAFTIFGIFNALAYLATAAGGYLADNFLGIRRCLVIGLLFEGVGLMSLAIHSQFLLPVSLALIIIGVGLFKTTPTHLMARSYDDEKDPRIDTGFTLYYMAINVGSFLASLLAGVVQRYFGWHMAFLMAGVLLLGGLAFYFFLRDRAAEVDSAPGKEKLSMQKWINISLGLVVSVIIASYLVSHAQIGDIFLTAATVLVFGYFAYEIITSEHDEKLRIVACLTLIIMGFVFYVLYFQAYTSIVMFINRSVNRVVMGIEIPTVFFFSLNATFVLILGPVLAWVYGALAKRNKDPAITVKFPLGLLITSLCFFTLVLGGYFANSDYQASPIWVVLAYFFYTLGEMLVSALGIAMITHIAPRRMYGIMMGTWFLIGMSLSSAVSGLSARIASVPDELKDPAAIAHIYNVAFIKIGVASLICALLAFAIGPYIKKIAKL